MPIINQIGLLVREKKILERLYNVKTKTGPGEAQHDPRGMILAILVDPNEIIICANYEPNWPCRLGGEDFRTFYYIIQCKN